MPPAFFKQLPRKPQAATSEALCSASAGRRILLWNDPAHGRRRGRYKNTFDTTEYTARVVLYIAVGADTDLY